MIYLDSSALLKLLYEEPESAALATWIDDRDGLALVSSELAKVETLRACRRLNAQALPAARALLRQLDLVPLSGPVVEAAAEVGADLLRTLDALHLAGALSIGDDLTAFVAYDSRLLEAAAAAGLACVSPGSPG